MARYDDLPPLPGALVPGPATEVWASKDWMWDASRWMDEVLERRGVTRDATTPKQPTLTPWFTRLVADTDHGRVRMVAGLPETTSESVLMGHLATVVPDAVPSIWAADRERRWFLMPAESGSLREVETEESRLSLMSGVLRRYAGIQRASAAVADDMVRDGVLKLTPGDIVKQWRRLGLSPNHWSALSSTARRLEELGLPLTVQHDDLRSGTVLADGTTAGLTKARITEWMHAYVGHPLLSLYEPLRATTEGLDDAAAAEARARLLRAYSSGWGDALGSGVLHRAVDDALLLGRMSRVLSWRRALTRASDAELRSWGRTGAALIREVDEILEGQRQA